MTPEQLRAQLQAKQPSSQPTQSGPTNDLKVEVGYEIEKKRVLIRINKHVNMIAFTPEQAKSHIANLLASCKDIGMKIAQELKWE